MRKDYSGKLKQKLDSANFAKLAALHNTALMDFVAEYVALCDPASVFVRTDSAQDADFIRRRAIERDEEKKLATKGHTVHFDGPFDQGRDKEVTRYLIPKGQKISYYVNSIERTEALREIRQILHGIMAGQEMYVSFFCLGPQDSDFSILAVQITDSAYVLHSEDILYRPGYEQFKKRKDRNDFFKFVHSAGRLDSAVSTNVDKKRIYIDLENDLIYSANTQYAGNSVGLKKLALRLAIQRACSQGWLAEHMFLMGVHDLENKKAYFCGAYPSMCGKTSTAMISGETVVGDDLVYLRSKNSKAYSVNVERGIFGIIKDVNAKDDPLLFKALGKEGEVIFSNVLVDDKHVPFWIGKNKNLPHRGVNYSGEWFPGKTDAQGNEIPPSHKNARYTIRLAGLDNVDEHLERPQGVPIRGIIYGGRDSDTWVPVEQALSWQQGIVMKAACLESETTAATLGQEGVRSFNPMSNIDFLSVPLGKYIEANLVFGKNLTHPPLVFSVNYFLRNKQGQFLNSMQDKRIWLKWMRLRVDKKVKALKTPTGLLPLYRDLTMLFEKVLAKQYSQKEYEEQFALRIPENLQKLERMENIYQDLQMIPAAVAEELRSQKERLKQCAREHGDYVSPQAFEEVR